MRSMWGGRCDARRRAGARPGLQELPSESPVSVWFKGPGRRKFRRPGGLILGCKAAAHSAQLTEKRYQNLLSLSNYLQRFFDACILLAQS